MKYLKVLVITITVAILITLGAATFLEKSKGTEFVHEHIYASWWFVALWIALVVSGTAAITKYRLWRQPVTMLIHVSFITILSGAFITHLYGEQGSMVVFKGNPTNEFVHSNGLIEQLPFTVLLEDFEIKHYRGTLSAQDFVSKLKITQKGKSEEGVVSMNNIYSYKGYRFYQSGYDEYLMASKFSISHDPYGIAVTYAGYGLLLISLALFFFAPGSRYRRLLSKKTAILILLAVTNIAPAKADNTPKIVPTDVAEELGNLYIYHNGRICPFQTYAIDFVSKLYGNKTYRGRNAEEVTAGWIFFPDTWKNEPMIKIKGSQVKKTIGKDEKYYSLRDFANEFDEYKLNPVLDMIYRGQDIDGKDKYLAADEKIMIINNLFTGSSLKFFPVKDDENTIHWYSASDELPSNIDIEKAAFIHESADSLARMICTGQYTKAKDYIHKIRQFQTKEAEGNLPSDYVFKAEKRYNAINSTKTYSIICVAVGFLTLFLFIYLTVKERKSPKALLIALNLGILAIIVHLSYCMYLRYIICNHLPLSNGFETMQTLALISFIITLLLQKKHSFAMPFGYIIGGFALIVSMLGQSNPQITNLMPVLHSPLLSIHVMLIMVSYALFGFCMINGIAALALHKSSNGKQETMHLQRLSLLMLYPAAFMLAAGIIFGAIWANVSWGRYWGWDPKEVWALITLLIYAIPLHQSIRWLEKPMVYHLYMIISFLSVLMTYFGVNFFLSGMHSYS